MAVRAGRSRGKIDGGAAMQKDVMILSAGPLWPLITPQRPGTLPGFWRKATATGSELVLITAVHTHQRGNIVIDSHKAV